jgi:riboflavin kinase/FMN adenylyltransferase
MNDFHGKLGLTIGNFEGFHRGHREIVQTLLSECGDRMLRTAVITFKEHPLKLLRGVEPERLSLPHEKLVNLRNTGIDLLFYLDFSAEFADTEPESFLRMLQRELSPVLFCLGTGFRFGKGNQGDIDFLRRKADRYGYDLLVVDDVMHLGGPVSSTRIRDAVKRGDFELTDALLGQSYHLYVTGEHRMLQPLCMNCAFPDEGRYLGVLHDDREKGCNEMVVERVEEGFYVCEEVDLKRNGLYRLQFAHRLDP